jgi:phospholipid/cholesterol/gamma-HCH transport system substrate-binding protein
MAIKNFRERSPRLIGIISILAIAGGTLFAFSIDKIPTLKQAYTIQGQFADATGLTTSNQVRVAGIKVGQVTGIELTGDKVLVTMEINNSTQIPKAATAEIKLATLLGTKYVNINGEGGGPYMQSGDLIPLSRTSVPYEIFQASNQGTKVLQGLNGNALNNALGELTKVVKAARSKLGVALTGLSDLGQGLNSKQQDLKDLLANADQLTGLLSGQGQHINRLIDSSNVVLQTLADKQAGLRSLLHQTNVMAASLDQVLVQNQGNLNGILSHLHRALLVLNHNVKNLGVALQFAGPSSRYFGSIFQHGRWGDIYSCALVLTATCEQKAP